MLPECYKEFLKDYLKVWKSFSLIILKEMISHNYKAREVTVDSKILDFGYEESINGWKQAFSQLKDNAEWVLTELGTIPLKENEVMTIISATLIIEGKQIDTANLFFQTFKKGNNEKWKLIRSYIEAGIPMDHVESLSLVHK